MTGNPMSPQAQQATASPPRNTLTAPLAHYVPELTPEMRLMPARPLAHFEHAMGIISRMDPGKGTMHLVKDALDGHREVNRRLAQAKLAATANDSWLVAHGFVKPSTGDGVSGRTFVDWLLGPFWRAPERTDGLCRVDPAMCAGWNRLHGHASSAGSDIGTIHVLDAEARTQGTESAVGYWIEPFPLVWMSRGRSRVDLYARHGAELLLHLGIAAIAPARRLRLQRVFCTDSIVALHCDDAEFGAGPTPALLPFPRLSVPLLEDYGVRWQRDKLLVTPRSPRLAGFARHGGTAARRLSQLDRWRPSSWRRMVVEQGYV